MNYPRCTFITTLGAILSLDLGAILSLQQTIEQTIEQKGIFSNQMKTKKRSSRKGTIFL